MEEKYKCIYNMRLAGFLMMNGMRILRVDKNFSRPWRKVFIFENSKDIEKLIETYKELKSKENKDYGINNKNSKSSNKFK